MLRHGQREYNPTMLSNTVVRVRIPPLLDVVTYISLGVMSFLVARGLLTPPAVFMLFGLCSAYALLYHFVFRAGRYVKNPTLYFGSQLVVLILMLLLRAPFVDGINFIFLMVSIHAALVLKRRAASVWIAVYFVTVSMAAFLRSGPDAFFAAAFYLATYAVCGFFGYILQQAELARQHNQQLIDELKSTQGKVQELAVVEERNRLARDLHDSVKQQVFAISMQLSAARTTLSETDKSYTSVVESERLAQQAGSELTSLIQQLRPPSLESKSFQTALQDYLAEWSKQNGVEVKLNIADHLPLNSDTERELFRVTQEALSNIARHSHATKAMVELIHENNETLLCVADNGEGFDTKRVQQGVGLQSMRERLSQIGATFHIQSDKNQGTQITAKVKRA